MDLTKRETATILAALRFYQTNFYNTRQMKEEMTLHFQDDELLDHEEIEDLCERINCGLIKTE